MKVCPRAQYDQFVIKDLDGELLVYDQRRHVAHCLNDTAAKVWMLCDGTATIEDLVEAFGGEQVVGGGDPVRLAVEELEKAGLVEILAAPEVPNPSRRSALRKVALLGGLAAVPVVMSVLAPRAYAQASGTVADPCAATPIPLLCSCTASVDCEDPDGAGGPTAPCCEMDTQTCVDNSGNNFVCI